MRIKEEYKVLARINKIQNNGCFCDFLPFASYEGYYGFMPQSLMFDHYDNGVCDLKKFDTITAYVHEVKSDGLVILSDEFVFKQKLASEKSMPIEKLEISKLGLGIVIGLQEIDYSKKYIVVGCTDGTVRFIDPYKESVNPYLKGIKTNDIVLVDIAQTDEVEFVISLSDLHYYESDDCQYNEIIYQKTNCRIPNKYIEDNDFFIFFKKGYLQVSGYCRYRKKIYILDDLNHTECELIIEFFQKGGLQEPKEIIEDIESYLNDENIIQIIESFTIINEATFIHRPGKDDYYYVHKISKKFKDEYINSLFPTIKEEIYSDRGFCSAESMSIDFEKRPYKDEELESIKEAKNKYNKEEHRVYLLNKKFSELKANLEYTYKRNHKIFVNEVKNMLLDYGDGFKFGKEYNILLRNYQKTGLPF